MEISATGALIQWLIGARRRSQKLYTWTEDKPMPLLRNVDASFAPIIRPVSVRFRDKEPVGRS